MYVVLLGAPGAGKGTQAPIIAQAVGGTHLSTGDMLREAVRRGTSFGNQARQYMAQGLLVPDEIVLGMVVERLNLPDAINAVVLDGFPRNVAQAQELDDALAAEGKHLDLALYINVPRVILMDRLGGRWTCSECQAIYHEINRPPRQAGICDKCGGELHQRADDRPDAVERRLEVYLAETLPLVDYYRERGVMQEIDGNQALEYVTADLLQALRARQGKSKV